MTAGLLANVTGVAVAGVGVMIEGVPGSGKSTLALELIDRGAVLIGDDGLTLERHGSRLVAQPPPRIAGQLEIRGLGIVTVPATSAPLGLIITLGDHEVRLPEPAWRTIEGVRVPVLAFRAGGHALAVRTEWALRLHAQLSD